MLYTTRRKALSLGMTHEGRYFNSPAWFGPGDAEYMRVIVKFAPFNLWSGLCAKHFPSFMSISEYRKIGDPIPAKRT